MILKQQRIIKKEIVTCFQPQDEVKEVGQMNTLEQKENEEGDLMTSQLTKEKNKEKVASKGNGTSDFSFHN